MVMSLRVSHTPFQDIVNQLWSELNPGQILKKNMSIEDIANVIYDEELVKEIGKISSENFIAGKYRSVELPIPEVKGGEHKYLTLKPIKLNPKRIRELSAEISDKEAWIKRYLDIANESIESEKNEIFSQLTDFMKDYKANEIESEEDKEKQMLTLNRLKNDNPGLAQLFETLVDFPKYDDLKNIRSKIKRLKFDASTVKRKDLEKVYESTKSRLQQAANPKRAYNYSEMMDRIILTNKRYKETLDGIKQSKVKSSPKKKAMQTFFKEHSNDMLVLLENEGKVRDVHAQFISLLTSLDRNGHKSAGNLIDKVSEEFEQYIALGKEWDKVSPLTGEYTGLSQKTTAEAKRSGETTELTTSPAAQRFKGFKTIDQKGKTNYINMVREMADSLKIFLNDVSSKEQVVSASAKKVLSKNPSAKLRLFALIKKNAEAVLSFGLKKGKLIPVSPYTRGTEGYSQLMSDAKKIQRLLNQNKRSIFLLEAYAEQEYGLPISINIPNKKQAAKNALLTLQRKTTRDKKLRNIASKLSNETIPREDVLVLLKAERNITDLLVFLQKERKSGSYRMYIENATVDEAIDKIYLVAKGLMNSQIDDSFANDSLENISNDLDTPDSLISRKLSYIDSKNTENNYLLSLMKEDDEIKETVKILRDSKERVLKARNEVLDNLITLVNDSKSYLEKVIDAVKNNQTNDFLGENLENFRNTTDSLEKQFDIILEGIAQQQQLEVDPLYELVEKFVNGISDDIIYDIDYDLSKNNKVYAIISQTFKYDGIMDVIDIIEKLQDKGEEEE